MKKARGLLSLILSLLLVLPYSCAVFAEDAESFDAPDLKDDTTKVTAVDSVEELARESAAADNTAFFTIDASAGGTDESLATEELQNSVDEILSGNRSDSKKQKKLAETLNDSGYYTAVEGDESNVEVTARFASQRLRLTAGREKEINAFGATKAVYYDGYYLLSYDSEEATMLAYEALASEYGEDALMVDRPVRISGSVGWGTPYMGMDAEKTIAEEGGEVVVAVCDTGVYSGHSIFGSTNFVHPYNAITGGSAVSDDNGHGTAVAGIVAESTPSNVKIMPIKVLDKDGNGHIFDMFNGVQYAEEHGADIINLSLGLILYENKAGDERDIAAMKEYDEIFKAYDALIVSASGNDGKNLDRNYVFEVPGELESTVCVGAFDKDGVKSGFSNYGEAIDLAAPGDDLTVATNKGKNRYETDKMGTSFSSPYIAAAAAIIKAENENADRDELRNALDFYAEDMGDEGRDVYFGAGCPRFGENKDIERGGDLLRDGISVSGIRDMTYTGGPVTQDPVVELYWIRLIEGTDYTIEYEDNVDVGTASMSIIGKGDYSGRLDFTFEILPRHISPTVLLSGYSFAYTGQAVAPSVRVLDNGVQLTEGEDYTLTYSDGRVMPGSYYVNVAMKGSYTGNKTVYFSIGKLNNNMSVKGRTARVRRSKLRKKTQKLAVSKVLSVNDYAGSLKYKKVSGSGRLKIDNKTGRVSVKKGSPKGKYKMKVKVTAAGDSIYKSASRTVTVTVRVK